MAKPNFKIDEPPVVYDDPLMGRREFKTKWEFTQATEHEKWHFWGLSGVFRGPGWAEKSPGGGFSPANQGLRAGGRSRLIDHSWFQCPSAFRPHGRQKGGR